MNKVRLPAEWEPQSGIQLTWPDESTPWYELDKVQSCYAHIASAVQRFERLMIVCTDPGAACLRLHELADAEGLPLDIDAVSFVECPVNDTWARDHGGISVLGEDGGKYLYDFVFNGWGLKFASDLDNQITRNIFSAGTFRPQVRYVDMRPFVLEGGSIDTDGCGTLMTTERCLCSLNRNEYLSKEEIEARLKGMFGLERVIWLSNGEIDGDDTDGHVDILARFASPDTIVYTKADDPSAAEYDKLLAMEAELKALRTLDGRPYNLIPLPLPAKTYLDGYPLPASYANFLIVNGGVLMPGCADAMDATAAARLSEAFPGREVVTIDCRALLSGHGGLHCVTMNFPKGYL